MLVISVSALPARAAVVSRAVLKSFFQTGDVPTQEQFATFIDSTINFVDDRYLLGLKVYNPQVTYITGDTVIFNRLSIGDPVGQVAEGTTTTPPAREFANWGPLNPNDPSAMDVATDFAGQSGFMGIQLQDGTGQINYGYLQMGMDSAASALHPAIHVDYIVYESEPNKPITVASVPEPSSALFLLSCGGMLLARRRRMAV